MSGLTSAEASKGTTDDMVLVPADAIARQLDAIFRAWGMDQALIAPTIETMVETDLRGIDSHGITMIMRYEELLKAGALKMQPNIRITRETPAIAHIDADGAIGHAPSVQAMELACDKAAQVGVGVVVVRNSNHFGPAGAYPLRAARRGFIGMAATGGTAISRCIPPTRGRESMFATNPLAFAAPAQRNRPFVLDFATSTVAAGKVKLCWLNDKPVPDGWVLDEDGRSVSDAARAYEYSVRLIEGGLTPLGGTPEMSSHKGYGLAAMVDILSTTLSGACYAPGRKDGSKEGGVGHFFLAMDPAAFRSDGEFESDLDDMIDALHNSKPIDAALPVLVHGDPEWSSFDERQKTGVPLPKKLVALVYDVAKRCNAEFTLGEPPKDAGPTSMWGAN